MKKKLLLYICLFFTSVASGETEYSLKSYFQNNILQLDPIEGVYDVQLNMKYVTPYVNESSNIHSILYIKETYRGSKDFILYVKVNEGFSQSTLRISRIGESAAYYFYCQSSQARFVLENESRFRAVVPLDHASAVKVTGNPNLSSTLVKVTAIYECIKTYPTSSMYLEAAKEDARRAEKELQEAKEEAQKKAGWYGSGFALNQGHIVTNYHVVEDAKTILVKGVKGDFDTEYRATVVASDKVNDIAIIKIVDERFKGFGNIPYKIKRSMLEVGESVWALGYPMMDVMGEEVKFTDGKISSRSGIQGDLSVYQISVPIQPGNSGGPLFDNSGNIIGITSSGLNRETFNSENVNYAIKSSYLCNLIESSLSPSIIPQGTAMQGQTLPQKIKIAKKYVYMILCSRSSSFFQEKMGAHKETLQNGDIVYNQPKYYTGGDLRIKKVTISSSRTIIECEWTNRQYDLGWCCIDPKTHLKVFSNNVSYGLLMSDGIKFCPEKTTATKNEVVRFTLTFEGIPKDTKGFDLVENEGSSFNSTIFLEDK